MSRIYPILIRHYKYHGAALKNQSRYTIYPVDNTYYDAFFTAKSAPLVTDLTKKPKDGHERMAEANPFAGLDANAILNSYKEYKGDWNKTLTEFGDFLEGVEPKKPFWSRWRKK